ncbi:DUF5336 domain-containing protein [Mycobacterium deserti]|uniref:DUF5336 domain-containing protein n=1 Tax=Mycobacterium deserti TaxID=2978347 RepID=A0ABT2M574_9MYCO|nr:DUF5336 domain-containing protein [Mycobacterium deserti]MCT7657409.1 DUF5336 domain-containing protein [Mycobacterium deserti]
MSYPQGQPGSPGYPQAQQQPTTSFAAPTQQFGRVPDAGPAADVGSKLPVYLGAAVAALGLLAYLSIFFPLLDVGSDLYQPSLMDLGVVAALLAALIAAVSLVPKQKGRTAIVAVLAVLGFLQAIALLLTLPEAVTVDVGLYLIIAFTLLQAIVAVAALLFAAGVITPPAPKPKYDQQYGQYGGGPGGQYYGQPHQGAQQQFGQPQQLGQQQRPGYPSQYGGYPGAPSTGGYAGGPQQGGAQGGPPTPPTGFPTYGQPPSGSSPTTQGQGQQSSSSQSGPAPS